MSNKQSKVLKSRYVRGSGGCVNLIALSKADMAKNHCHKFLVQWSEAVHWGDWGYQDSGYQGYSFTSYEKALEYFNAYR